MRFDFSASSNTNQKSRKITHASAGTSDNSHTLMPAHAHSHAHALSNHAHHSLAHHAHATCPSDKSQFGDKSLVSSSSHQVRQSDPQSVVTVPRPARAEPRAASDGSAHGRVSVSRPPPPPPPPPNSADRTPPSVGADLPTKHGGARVAEPPSAASAQQSPVLVGTASGGSGSSPSLPLCISSGCPVKNQKSASKKVDEGAHSKRLPLSSPSRGGLVDQGWQPQTPHSSVGLPRVQDRARAGHPPA